MHRLFDPKFVQVDLQGDSESEAPLHWKASLAITRDSGESIHAGCPQFGPPEMGESLARWLMETGPAIQLDMQVSAPANQPGLASQLAVHAIGQSTSEAVSLVNQAAGELASWLSLYGERDHWNPSLPVSIHSGFVSAFRVERTAPDPDEPPWGGKSHHVGATARFLECLSWNNLALSLKLRANFPSEETFNEYDRLTRVLKRRCCYAETPFDHSHSKKLLERLRRAMDRGGQPFEVSLELYSPEPPDAITRVLVQEGIEEWVFGLSWLEEAEGVAPQKSSEEIRPPLAMDCRSASLLLKWMSGVRTGTEEEEAPQRRIPAAAGDVIPF